MKIIIKENNEDQMDTKIKNEKIEQAIEMMSKDQDIIDIVKKIESKIPTTKGHYGDYMAFLSPFVSEGKTMTFIMGEACIRAGAD